MSEVFGRMLLLGRLLLGFASATLTLILIFVAILALRGQEDFEWGFGASLFLSWMVITAAYWLGAALLATVSWPLTRAGWPINPSYVVFGVSAVLFIWLATEVPSTANLMMGRASELEAIILSVLGAGAVALVAGGFASLANRRQSP